MNSTPGPGTTISTSEASVKPINCPDEIIAPSWAVAD
jgi:hypothetical protein